MKVAVVLAGSFALAGLLLLCVVFLLAYDLIFGASQAPASPQGHVSPSTSRSHMPKDTMPCPRTTLLLDLYRSAYPFIRGKIHNVESDMLVDSGSTSTLIDNELSDRLKLEGRHATVLRTNNGRMPAMRVEGAKLAFGEEVMMVSSLVRADLAWLAYRLGRMVPVVLGGDLFDAYVVDLDYPHGRIALYDRDSFSYAGTGATVPIRISSGRTPLVEVRIEGRLSAWLTLDTASGNAVVLSQHVWKTLHSRDDRRATVRMLGGGPGGSFSAEVGSLESVTLAGYEFRNVPTAFLSDGVEPTLGGDEREGFIGAELLTRFRVILDYSRRQAHLEPWAEAATRLFRKDRIGLHGIFQGGQVVITFVAAGSPASKAGVRIGDSIQAIDGRALSVEAWEAECVRWQVIPPGTVVVLMEGKSGIRKIVAAEYY